MSQKAEILFDAITGIREDLVEEAQRHVFCRRARWRRYGGLAACLVLAALAGEDLSGRIAGIFLYFMAVIEQINYFHVRLSYETVNGTLLVIEPLKKLFTGTGKRPHLRKDIDAYLGR